MPLIDLILNLAGLLLWLNCRSLSFDPLAKTLPITLVGTLRRAEPPRVRGWHLLMALIGLLLGRALLYWQIGPAVNWTPKLPLGAIAISFRSDYLSRMLLFSALSFAVTLAVFYLCLLLLSMLNGRSREGDPFQRLMRLHLGRIDNWPWPAKLLLPLVLAALLWLLFSPVLTHWKIIPSALSARHRIEQAIVIGFGAYLPWRYVIGALLALCLISSYVYLGNHWFWNFIGSTGRNLLVPLRWLPLRLGKIDFAPIVGIALVFIAGEFAEHGLTRLYERLPL